MPAVKVFNELTDDQPTKQRTRLPFVGVESKVAEGAVLIPLAALDWTKVAISASPLSGGLSRPGISENRSLKAPAGRH